MTSIDEELLKLIEDCPILTDENFLKERPGIVGVAAFLDGVHRTLYRMQGNYEIFDRLGVRDAKTYLTLIQNGNVEAIRIYEKTRDILRLYKISC